MILLCIAIPLEVFFNFDIGLGGFVSKLMWIAIIVFSVAEALMLFNLYQLRRLQKRFEAGGKDTPYLDVTEQNLTPPQKLQANIQEFESLGFTPFAVLDASENTMAHAYCGITPMSRGQSVPMFPLFPF